MYKIQYDSICYTVFHNICCVYIYVFQSVKIEKCEQ